MASVESRGVIDTAVEQSKKLDYLGIGWGILTGQIGLILLSIGLLMGKKAFLDKKK